MHLAYIDESGDVGSAGSRTYTLGCVLVEAAAWPQTFDDILDFRRALRKRFKLPVTAELRANYLLRSVGQPRLDSHAAYSLAV